MASERPDSDLKRLPKVDRVLLEECLHPWVGSSLMTETVRVVLEDARLAVREGREQVPDAALVAERALERFRARFAPQLRSVINGTGIIIHTNLGRSPLSETAIEAMVRAARGYSTLEYNLEQGKRGSRHYLVRELLLALTGAEDALVVNNNAAALLLALTALAKRKQVIVSRGELVEIGGSFRIPDICRASGAKMVEVGTTNRTRLSDYHEAITDRTGMLLRVHPSNFRVVGFTESVTMPELVQLGLDHNLPVVNDLGSGALVDVAKHSPLPREPMVSEAVVEGSTVVTFSGDKLLGGPQAGIAVGKAEQISKMRKHPLMRAIRPDKLTFAALDATLRAYLKPATLTGELPLWRMLSTTPTELEKWGSSLLRALQEPARKAGMQVSLGPSAGYSGGGSLPEEHLPSVALLFAGPARKLTSLQRRLRLGEPSVIGYLKEDRFFLDLRTMSIEEPNRIIGAVTDALING